MRNGTSLSQKAGNAIEVITSLITMLHAIWDREFVFHKRYSHLASPACLYICIIYVCAYTYLYYLCIRTYACMHVRVHISAVHREMHYVSIGMYKLAPCATMLYVCDSVVCVMHSLTLRVLLLFVY